MIVKNRFGRWRIAGKIDGLFFVVSESLRGCLGGGGVMVRVCMGLGRLGSEIERGRRWWRERDRDREGKGHGVWKLVIVACCYLSV